MQKNTNLSRRQLLALGALAGAAPWTASTWAAAQPLAEVPAGAKRPVVFDVGALDALQALGASVAGAPRLAANSYLSIASQPGAQGVGTLFEPDYQALSQVQPDLIVVGGRSASKQDVLAKIAPTVSMAARSDQLLNDVTRNLAQLGRITQRDARARELSTALQAQVSKARQAASSLGTGLVLLQIGDKLMAQPPGSRFGQLHDVFGLQAVLPSSTERRGNPLTPEDIAALTPRYVFVIDRNAGTGGQGVRAQDLFASGPLSELDVVKQKRLVMLQPQHWYLCGLSGPIALGATAMQLQSLAHS